MIIRYIDITMPVGVTGGDRVRHTPLIPFVLRRRAVSSAFLICFAVPSLLFTVHSLSSSFPSLSSSFPSLSYSVPSLSSSLSPLSFSSLSSVPILFISRNFVSAAGM